MALFGSGRDASLVRSINRERVNKVMALEVELYKLSRYQFSVFIIFLIYTIW